jgi:hypothetical protein
MPNRADTMGTSRAHARYAKRVRFLDCVTARPQGDEEKARRHSARNDAGGSLDSKIRLHQVRHSLPMRLIFCALYIWFRCYPVPESLVV